ncbi:hypothetical protein JI664_12895 [Rhodobacter sp. NTK016B]|uniref:hypothetical protein n=1 Tax=Rhodobacter sp. NTK016B TaxID=2759676 RepID=UPI001A8F2F72|nr:hypothetical protein [Rhodobacter sp. NTK016B]MBN8292865.1 hypothetical protein [Rhodobacter sp. NTK016B]
MLDHLKTRLRASTDPLATEALHAIEDLTDAPLDFIPAARKVELDEEIGAAPSNERLLRDLRHDIRALERAVRVANKAQKMAQEEVAVANGRSSALIADYLRAPHSTAKAECDARAREFLAGNGDPWIVALEARATAAEAQLAAAMEGAVRVRELVWREDGNDNDLHVADSVLGLYFIRFDPRANDDTAWMLFLSGKWVCFGTIEAAKAAAQADYERRILAALEPNPAALANDAAWLIDLIGDLGRAAFDIADNMEEEAETGVLTAWRPSFDALSAVLGQIEEKTPDQDGHGNYLGIGARLQSALRVVLPNQPQAERDALIAATLERAIGVMEDQVRASKAKMNEARLLGSGSREWAMISAHLEQSLDYIRALATQPQTDALAARDRAKMVEGMRIAAGIAFDRRGTQSGDTWDAGWYQACATVRHEILDAAEKEAGDA